MQQLLERLREKEMYNESLFVSRNILMEQSDVFLILCKSFVVFLILTEWVINGSSSRRIPYNPEIGKRQQAQGRRQKAQLWSRPPPPSTLHSGSSNGKVSSQERKGKSKSIHTFPGAGFNHRTWLHRLQLLLRLSPTSPSICVSSQFL